MTTKKEQKIKISFPFGLYFRQLFCPRIYTKFLNPFSFWRRYRINHLNNCWEFNTVQYLENCLKIEWYSAPSQNNERSQTLGKIVTEGGLPWKKTPRNTILISQPNFELKYRGITYRTSTLSILN